MKSFRYAVFTALFFVLAGAMNAQQTGEVPIRKEGFTELEMSAARDLVNAMHPVSVSFGQFQIVLPQDGENMIATPEQIKAAIVTILSPKPEEPFSDYEKRGADFGSAFQAASKNYSEQFKVVEFHYAKVVDGRITDLKSPTCRPEENIMIKARDEVTLEPGGKWTPFENFRDQPVGDEIDPTGTDAQIFARVRKQIDSAVEQVLRTSYDPFFKTAWIEVLRAFKDGKTGPEAGSPRIEFIRQWSNHWEITRGKNSVVFDAEFSPVPRWLDAKVVVFKLDKFCREVGHALPCGLNPIVPKYRTRISVDKELPPIPGESKPPAKCECSIVTAKGGGVGNQAEIFPDQTLTLEARVVGADKVQIQQEMWSVGGVNRLGNNRFFTFKPADYNFLPGEYVVMFAVTDQFGRTTMCPFKVVVKPRPVVSRSLPPQTKPTPKPEPKIRKGGGNGKWVALAAGVGGGVACAIFCRGGGSPGVASAPGVIKPPVGASGPQ